jgi:dTDP-4-dehydrorhamnose 3,5-epimerase
VIFRATPLDGAYVVEQERHADERGFFARTWAAEELAERGLDVRVAHMNTSFNARAGTLRGMHLQAPPHAEAKLVRATRGGIWDVAVDLRPNSPSYLRWHAVELDADNGLGYFIPAGCAHGFVTLANASEVLYVMSEAYAPDAAGGVRWDDPAFGIEWPEPPATGWIMAERDRTWPDFAP